jgi:NAD(P)H dehydrogenase (quinone)
LGPRVTGLEASMKRRSLAFVALTVVCLGAGPEAQTRQVRILIAYHSDTGHTARLGDSVGDGASRVENVAVTVRRIEDVSEEDIERADGIVLGTPVQWAGMTAHAKTFLDRLAVVLGSGLGEGRTAAAFCTGGAVSSGKELARLSILAAFLNMRFVVIGGVEADGFGNLGAQATTGPASPGLDERELEDGRRFGERYARLTAGIARTIRP